MAKVIFSIQYDVLPAKRDEYLNIMRELKTLVSSNGLLSYSVYEKKNKQNSFEEVYTFENDEAYEAFDDNQNERIDILMSKLSDLIKENSTKYTTMFEVLD
ncbi:MAG TPA: antibiotic biosynthesis monooxygenase [Ignavibacteriales bacterium]|nr:antibiotic biosynthesis monooxygenase [Ignavibacteriales bacterium]